MTYTGQIYFFGQFKPYHVEGDSVAAVAARLTKAIANMREHDREYLAGAIDRIASELERGYASASSEYGARGVKIKNLPHDPFLDELTATFPDAIGLDYSA